MKNSNLSAIEFRLTQLNAQIEEPIAAAMRATGKTRAEIMQSIVAAADKYPAVAAKHKKILGLITQISVLESSRKFFA